MGSSCALWLWLLGTPPPGPIRVYLNREARINVNHDACFITGVQEQQELEANVIADVELELL